MKPDRLQHFIKKKGGIESCINLLGSELANPVGWAFVALVRSAHFQEGDEIKEMELGALPECQALLLKGFETDNYEEVENYISKALDLPQEVEGIKSNEAGRAGRLAAMNKELEEQVRWGHSVESVGLDLVGT